MLDASLKTQLQAYLERLTRPVHLVASLDDGASSAEMLALLQDKTRGNLDPAEAKLLDDLLYDLRMRFVQAQQQPRVVQP